MLENKRGNIYETRKDRGKVTNYYGRPIETHQHSFERYHPRPPRYGLTLPEIGGLQLSYPLLSQEQVKLRTSSL